MFAAIVTGVAFGLRRFAGAEVSAGGKVPGFAFGAEVGAEEGGIGTVFHDAMACFASFGLAGEASFFAGAGETDRCGRD